MKPLPERVQVSASVRITVIVDLPDVWGGDCPMSQIYGQAEREARERIAKAFPAARRGRIEGFRVIGDPEVMAVTVAAGGES